MSHKIVLMKYFLQFAVIVLLVSCSRRSNEQGEVERDSVTKAMSSDENLNGTFEYSEPLDESYFYLKLEMQKKKDSSLGHLWAGIYLSKSEAAGYTNPGALAECELKGILGKEPDEMQLTLTKSERLEQDAPDLLGMMNFPDLDSMVTATIWSFSFEKGVLTSKNGLLMPDGNTPVKFVWTKIK